MSISSTIIGHEVVWQNNAWVWADTKEPVPESWSDRCSGDGHMRYIDPHGDRRYEDNDELVGSVLRPCARCGQYPNEQGDDACLGHLGSVMNACCGHGRHEGYIQFDTGVTIRGMFWIEKDENIASYQSKEQESEEG